LEFFQQSGFRNLAYCGYPGVFFSDQREEFFRLETKGLKNGHVYSPRVHRRVSEDLYRFEKGSAAGDQSLARWLCSLPKPVAILACNDIRGQQLINACREAGIETPDEVAVLGVDDDQIICRLCRPTLSSIEPDTEEIGRLAAQLIASQLEGKRVASHHLVPPRHIVQRKSTDTVAASHPLVLQATRLIRERGFGNASVDQVCEASGVSRSTLDNLFIRNLGRSVSGEITRLRLQRCSNLLRNTDLSLCEIASRCGFSSSTYFCRFFKRNTGIPPMGYRGK
jgi:LacI family transcriptional regulator